MATLTPKQLLLIEDLKDDIEFYKDELDSQIKSHTLYIIIGVIIAVGVGVAMIIKPDLLDSLNEISDSMDTVAGFIGETIPMAFITKSYNNTKDQKRKLKGLRIFEKTINRMEHNVVPNSETDIIAVEGDLAIYIST
tara:strand:+ start:21324 stop:21734 length:411 start_codon:yes stop_codon:yes gene_type:complete